METSHSYIQLSLPKFMISQLPLTYRVPALCPALSLLPQGRQGHSSFWAFLEL